MPSVKPGDCFISLAASNDFHNYHTLYAHAGNASIKSRRPNPNMLAEGDLVEVPPKRTKEVDISLGQETKFIIDHQVTRLRVAIKDIEGKLPAIVEFKLQVGDVVISDKPTEGGLVEMEIPPVAVGGTLKLKVRRGEKPKPSTAEVRDSGSKQSIPPYPPAIAAKDFIDPALKEVDEMVDIEYTLKIGFLEPHTQVRGGLQRLNNLGCRLPNPSATEAKDTATQLVVKSYQKFKGKPSLSGDISDLLLDLEAWHDKV
jgi:hypothetical protein